MIKLSKICSLIVLIIVLTSTIVACAENTSSKNEIQKYENSEQSGFLNTLESEVLNENFDVDYIEEYVNDLEVGDDEKIESDIESDISESQNISEENNSNSTETEGMDEYKNTENKITDETEESLVTAGIEYQFDSYNIVAVSSVSEAIAAAINSPHINKTGEAEPGWYVAITSLTISNISDATQYIMLNGVSIVRIDGEGAPVKGSTCSMRYYDKGNPNSKQYFGITLAANETRSVSVGFLIDKEFLGDGEYAFLINPDGIWPGNENTREVPITLIFK